MGGEKGLHIILGRLEGNLKTKEKREGHQCIKMSYRNRERSCGLNSCGLRTRLQQRDVGGSAIRSQIPL